MKALSFLLWILIVASGAGATSKAPLATPVPPSCREGLPPGKYSDQSLYRLDSKWTSDSGREVKLDALRGRPQVVALFFTNCQHSCPKIVANMQAIEKNLTARVRSKVDFLLVTIDPDRDTTEVLQAYRAKHNLSIEHWTLLRGDAEAVKRLAESLGFRYFPGSQTQFAHSLLITIINGSGEIVFQQAGLNTVPDDAVQTLSRLVNGKSGRKR